MVNVAVSVGATIVTGTFTAVPFGGTTTVVSLTETDRTTGGGEKLVFPPQPVTAGMNTVEASRTRVMDLAPSLCRVKQDLLNLTILQHLFCDFFLCTRPLLHLNLAVQTLELSKSLVLFLRPAEGSIYQSQAIPRNLIIGIECDSPLQMRQGKIGLLLRHQGCGQAYMRVLKVRIVMERRFKELLCLVELIPLTMDLGQFVAGVGVTRIQL
jgi:hypothetical protein